jgi:hypothetical protein
VIYFVGVPLVSRTIKAVGTFTVSLVVFILMGSPLLGWFLQPMAPWWFGVQPGSGAFTIGSAEPSLIGTVPVITAPADGPQPLVSDAQRYLLAIGAGFSAAEAVTATAISIAENGGGNPAALSGENFDHSRDIGIWQVNSAWWPQFGGQHALENPVTNALAAHYIYGRQGWCAWSTYEASCGKGHNSAYAAYLSRAKAAAEK